MLEAKSYPKPLYVSIKRPELEALTSERDALQAEVKRLKQMMASNGLTAGLSVASLPR